MFDSTPAWAPPQPPARDWRIVDRALRAIRQRRAALDAEEARWLREAEALQIWRPLGMVSALDYLERVLGYAPRTAQDRLRVARALGDLPRLSAALAADELSLSAVRELTRVATPATEASWIAAAMAALVGLGWKPAIAIAIAAVAAAAAAHRPEVTLEQLIFDALRRCPVHKA